MSSTIIAWLLVVLFAYFTNRKWVFVSEVKAFEGIAHEIILFFVCRIETGIIDWACMYIFVDILKWNDVIIKFLANIFVIVLNYIISKLIVFRWR